MSKETPTSLDTNNNAINLAHEVRTHLGLKAQTVTEFYKKFGHQEAQPALLEKYLLCTNVPTYESISRLASHLHFQPV